MVVLSRFQRFTAELIGELRIVRGFGFALRLQCQFLLATSSEHNFALLCHGLISTTEVLQWVQEGESARGRATYSHWRLMARWRPTSPNKVRASCRKSSGVSCSGLCVSTSAGGAVTDPPSKSLRRETRSILRRDSKVSFRSAMSAARWAAVSGSLSACADRIAARQGLSDPG